MSFSQHRAWKIFLCGGVLGAVLFGAPHNASATPVISSANTRIQLSEKTLERIRSIETDCRSELQAVTNNNAPGTEYPVLEDDGSIRGVPAAAITEQWVEKCTNVRARNDNEIMSDPVIDLIS